MVTFLVIGEGRAAKTIAEYAAKRGDLVALLPGGADLTAYMNTGLVDWLLSVNNPHMIPGDVINLARKGALNLHPAPLPEYAGLYCHYWAHKEGARRFGATLHHMTARADTGAIVYKELFAVSHKDTPGTLFVRATSAGLKLVKRAIDALAKGRDLPAHPQVHPRRLYTRQMALDQGFIR